MLVEVLSTSIYVLSHVKIGLSGRLLECELSVTTANHKAQPECMVFTSGGYVFSDMALACLAVAQSLIEDVAMFRTLS